MPPDPLACQTLWRAVLVEALRCATGTAVMVDCNADRPGALADWLASEDFTTVCHLAGVAPEAVRAQVAELRRDPDRLRVHTAPPANRNRGLRAA